MSEDKNISKHFFSVVDTTSSNLLFIVDYIKVLACRKSSSLLNCQNVEMFNSANIPGMESTVLESLYVMNANFYKIFNTGVGQLIKKKALLMFVVVLENHLFDAVAKNLFVSQLKPSACLSLLIYKESFTHKEICDLLLKIAKMFEIINLLICDIKNRFWGLNDRNLPIYELTSFILKENILVKWDVFCLFNQFGRILKGTDSLECIDCMIVHSKGMDDYLVAKLSNFIKIIIKDGPGKYMKFKDIGNVAFENDMFSIANFDAYRIVVLDNIYLVKKFNLKNISRLPSGLSTAYLNIKNDLKYIGYMGFKQHSNGLKEYYYLSVEENEIYYIKSDNLEIFKLNENQILFFVLDLLHVLNILNTHRIKLILSTILFAVDVKNSKRWRFRVDDVGDFFHLKSDNLDEIQVFLIEIINRLLILIENDILSKFLLSFKKLAKSIRNSSSQTYFSHLINVINAESKTMLTP